MSSLSICSIAFMALLAFLGSQVMSLPRITGTTCHDKPNLSFSHPHCIFCPLSESLSHIIYLLLGLTVYNKRYCLVQFKLRPPFNARNSCPSISNLTVITLPFGPGPESP